MEQSQRYLMAKTPGLYVSAEAVVEAVERTKNNYAGCSDWTGENPWLNGVGPKAIPTGMENLVLSITLNPSTRGYPRHNRIFSSRTKSVLWTRLCAGEKYVAERLLRAPVMEFAETPAESSTTSFDNGRPSHLRRHV
jgi:hypothetical protein